MANIVVVIIVLALVGAAIAYIVKEKRRGVKCIGCPAAATCGHKTDASGCAHSPDGMQCACGCHPDTDR